MVTTSFQSLTAQAEQQYMVLIRPSQAVEQKIRRLKSSLRNEFDLLPQQLQGGYLLLARFSQIPMLEQKMMDRLRLIAMEAQPFRAILKDYFWVPDHTMGIQVANPAGMHLLLSNFKRESRLFRTANSKPYFNQYPAISLASRLQPNQYNALSKKYRYRHFSAAFMAEGMTVIRKSKLTGQWLVIEEMNFQNMPVFSRQGVLFS